MAHVTRCDSGNGHDLERGQRYLDIIVRNANHGPIVTRQLCADHARAAGNHYILGVFDSDFAEITATWREAL